MYQLGIVTVMPDLGAYMKYCILILRIKGNKTLRMIKKNKSKTLFY